jgi:hypothetical protein
MGAWVGGVFRGLTGDGGGLVPRGALPFIYLRTRHANAVSHPKPMKTSFNIALYTTRPDISYALLPIT